MGALCAQWFSDFLGRPLRLARFDPEAPRHADRKLDRLPIDAANAFQDGFPLLVASTASLDEVNRRLAGAGEAPVTLARFRPNLVLGGLDANGEDHLDEIVFAADGGAGAAQAGQAVRPLLDPRRRSRAPASAGHAVGDVLAHYRADPRIERRAHVRHERDRRSRASTAR